MINIGFSDMALRGSSKILMYFNGYVCFTKNSRYHIFGTILSLGTGNESMMEHMHASKERCGSKK